MRRCARCGADVSGEQSSLATELMRPVGLDSQEAAQLEALRSATLGDYDIMGELGRGGMATVYLAHDIALDRKVAIKVMSPALLAGEGMVERFKREARTAGALSHPNIIPIYAVKESAQVLYFVMKYIAGRTLDSIIKEAGPLPLPMTRAILHQVGGALGYAHAHGVVHRDMKPANIMIDSEGWAIVTDFGIAKAGQSQGLTMTGTAIGTPYYMSPEQCAAKKELTGASDQYSLGIVAYEMLTGRVPFTADSPLGIMYAHFHEPPPPITDALPSCPPDVAAALERMLEKEPAARFPDVESAVAALGAAPLMRDDAAMVRLRALAREGANAALAGTARTPVSPVPGSLLPPAPRVRTAAMASPATAAAPAAAKRSPVLLWGVPTLVAAAVAVTWLTSRPARPVPLPIVTPPAESVAPSATPPAESHPSVVAIPAPPPAPAPAEPPPAAPPPRAVAPRPVIVAKPPPAAAAPPSAPPRDETRVEIEAAIAAYAEALESRNLAHVRAAYPGLTPQQAQELGTFLQKTKDLRARLKMTALDRDGDRADATVEGTYEYQDLETGRTERLSVSLHATLRSDGSGWRLVSIR